MRTIFPYIGLLLEIFSVFLILPLIVAFFYNEPTTPFFIALIVSLFAGIILEKTSKRKPLNFWDALSLTALSFIIFSVLGSIPYLFYINGPAHITFINAFFESLSGFTTTGLSIFSTVANLPKSILFWRALTQWMGGMGIIIIFLSVLRSVRTSSMTLYRSQGLSEKIEPSLISTSRYILKIFITYTLLGIVALFATGLPLFDSITTAFTAISTGGFTVVDTFYTNPATLAVISILMLLGSINFILHSKLFKKNFNEFLKNPEVKGIAVMLIFLISAGFIVSGSLSISIFQMISALTATGFSITDTASLSPLFIVLIIIAMIIGSSSGSTAGGIKQMRFIIALKSILWTIKKTRAPPNAIIPFKINGKVIHSDIVKMTGIFIFTYILILVISSLILMFSGYTPQESIFQCASAQGTVGLSVIDISSTPIIVKLTLCIVMLLGRLEIFPLLILLYNVFSR